MGPDGDYEGAPRQVQYIDAQETVYSGWKKLHGIKVETVFLPNGISTVFGPVSARQNNCGTLALSVLDRFITLIQASLPLHERAMLLGIVAGITKLGEQWESEWQKIRSSNSDLLYTSHRK